MRIVVITELGIALILIINGNYNDSYSKYLNNYF